MFFKIPLIGTRFTDGLKYLANEAECFWLITDASVIAKSLSNRSHFITIDFKRLSEKEQFELGINYHKFLGHNSLAMQSNIS